MSMKKNSYMLNGNITSLTRHGVDRKAEDYSSSSPFAYCAGNPIRNIDPSGMYYLDSNSEFETDKDYNLIVIFSSDYKDFGLEEDYNIAVSSGVPVMVVENLEDLPIGLSHLTTKMNCQFENISLNDHGAPGVLNLGKRVYDSKTNFTSLEPFLKSKNVFIEGCSNGVGKSGSELTEKLALDTQSTVISSMHTVHTNYRYDGSNGLNAHILENPLLYNLYKVSYSGSKFAIIKDFLIDKNKGFSWKYF